MVAEQENRCSMNDQTMTTAEAIEAITAARDLERQGIPTTATQEALVEILKPKKINGTAAKA